MSIFQYFIMNMWRDGAAAHAHDSNRASFLYFLAGVNFQLTKVGVPGHISVTVVDLDITSITCRHVALLYERNGAFTSCKYRRAANPCEVNTVVMILGFMPWIDACAESGDQHVFVGIGNRQCTREIPDLVEIVARNACVARIMIVADGRLEV